MEKVLPNTEWARDWGAIYSKKFLASKDAVESEPISASNYDTKYNWVKNFVQAEVMQQMYKEAIGTDSKNDSWVEKFSIFFNSALEIKIAKYGNEILELLNNDFAGTVSKIRSLMRALYQAEHRVEEDMHLGIESRGMILDEIFKIISLHPEAAGDALSMNDLVSLVEEDIGEDSNKLAA